MCCNYKTFGGITITRKITNPTLQISAVQISNNSYYPIVRNQQYHWFHIWKNVGVDATNEKDGKEYTNLHLWNKLVGFLLSCVQGCDPTYFLDSQFGGDQVL